MTTIVGIFDDAAGLEKAGKRLAGADFENTVYDETIVAEELGEAAEALRFLAPGSAPEVDRHTIAQAFKDRLARDHDLSTKEIDAYATTFLHNGKFILVRTDAERAEQAMKILRDCGATRVNRHG
jgi:hypothetical protein